MRMIIAIMMLALAVMGLHIYALNKRIEYLKHVCASEYARGTAEKVIGIVNRLDTSAWQPSNTVWLAEDGTLKVLTNNVNDTRTAFEKEVAP